MKRTYVFQKSRLYRLCQIVAIFQVIVFVFLSFSIGAFAEKSVSDSVEMDGLNLYGQASNLKEGDLTYSQLQEMSPEDVMLPETISRSDAMERELVNRLYAQEEDLRTAVFQSRYGTKTAYIFDKPIKYVTEEGETRDKNTSISETGLYGVAYAMTDNSFQAYFGTTTSNGIAIHYGEYSLTMVPEASMLVSVATLDESRKSVLYNGAFGANTVLRYTTKLSGVKEDIILLSDVGKYNFQFLLNLGGLIPEKTEDGTWFLSDSNGNLIASLGDIIVNDSSGKCAFGEMKISSRSAGGYIVTVEVPVDFLKSSNTVYPVYIDPTITINEGSTSARILDYGVYTDEVYYRDAQWYSYMHFVSEAYGKVIYKLTDFYNTNGRFYGIDEYGIGKVTLYAKCYSNFDCNLVASPMLVDCGNEAEFFLDDELFGACSANNSSSTANVVSLNGTLSVDITEIARGWARYNRGLSRELYENPKNGFILSQDLTTNSLWDAYIATMEDAGDSNIYYTVDYSDTNGIFILQSRHSSGLKYLSVNEPYSETDNHYLPGYKNTYFDYRTRFIFKYAGDGKYLISPMYHPGCAILQSGAVQKIPDSIPNGFYWNIVAQSGGVVLKNCGTGKWLVRNLSASYPLTLDEYAVPSQSNCVFIWYMATGGWGSQQFRKLDSSEWWGINCHGYAMMRNDDVQEYATRMKGAEAEVNAEYLNSSSESVEKEVIEAMVALYASKGHQLFQEWLEEEGYEYSYRPLFSKNGEDENLSSNEYRVVLRVGGKLVDWVTHISVTFDYHFWYQTSDGRWAQKFATNEPYLLPYGVTPFSNESPAWYNSKRDFYYNSQVYCYVITVS